MGKRAVVILMAFCILTLGACESAEERADKHFQSSVELVEQGDVARAIVELRNVFQLKPDHVEARRLMARLQEDRGNPAGAYSQYRSLTEAQPDDLQAQRQAARLALVLGDWPAARRHVDVARPLVPAGQADPLIRGVELALAYRQARRDQDMTGAGEIAQNAAALLDIAPDQIISHRVVIDDLLLRRDWPAALTRLDAAIATQPEGRQLYMLRLGVLDRLDRPAAIEAQLRDMVDLFPDDDSIRRTLVRWYVSRDRAGDAEDFLRAQLEPAAGEAEPRVVLVSFLNQTGGPRAALAEIERILAETPPDGPNRPLYRSARASLRFELGDRDDAIAEMEALVTGAEPSDLTLRIKVALAKMREANANPSGARALVEEVLQADPSHVAALKKRAGWLIDDDTPDAALIELRRALDQDPRNAGVLTLMARAHERAGQRDLMAEMLSRAVQASTSAPDESLRYATFLIGEDRLRPAESVLLDALRLDRGNLSLMAALGDVYVRMRDWGRTQGVIDALSGLPGATAAGLADELTARMLAAQDRQADLQAFLEDLAAAGGGNDRAAASVLRIRLARGDIAGALAHVEELLDTAPGNAEWRLIRANILAMDGQAGAARDALRQVLAENQQNERAWIALVKLHRAIDDRPAADAALAEALRAMPDNPNLNWMQAGALERAGDIEGAIAIYERLYARNSDSALIANNLASLISSFRDDAESLERAYAIARRLRGTEVDAFRDTYGWIAALLGNISEALAYLEPAARGLPQDSTVRYHLARAYVMAGRDADALAAYRATRDLLADSARTMPYADDVAAEIARLSADHPSQN